MENGPQIEDVFLIVFKMGMFQPVRVMLVFRGAVASLSSQELGDRIHVLDPMDRIGSFENGIFILDTWIQSLIPLKTKPPNIHI